ncbi:MAG TPA: circularly permuted type 2 ATP-grasp protein, partial [Verrucomicrobiales bacterium]|nr:circularly permuted type 2 ATP-grasp protein [Verrucomicrobiales bacterium]
MPVSSVSPGQPAPTVAAEERARSPHLYSPAPDTWDEMIAADGSVRPHWQAFADFMAGTSPAQWESRGTAIARLLEDHGVTYNIYSDNQASRSGVRPWVLDSIPFILAEAEWKEVAAGLQQRARLLNAILGDIYGPQRLMREGWLPPALIFANPGYMRAACGVMPAGDSFLISHGTDLVRGPGGSWMVLADRAQAPSGKGYSLENRNIMASVLGEVFESSNVRGLTGFFEEERDSLRFLAPTRRG